MYINNVLHIMHLSLTAAHTHTTLTYGTL